MRNDLKLAFISKMRSLGNFVDKDVKERGSIYRITTPERHVLPKVNIRCKNKASKTENGDIYFYSINLNVLSAVSYVIYIMTDHSCFIVPKKYLSDRVVYMHPSNRGENMKVFSINHTEQEIILKGSREELFPDEYYFDFDYGDLPNSTPTYK